MFLDFDGVGNSRFRGAAIIVPQSRRHVANPGGNNFLHATCADELIKLHIRNRPDKSQISSLLADDFIARGERDQRFERAAHGDGHVIVNVRGNGIMKRAHFVHNGHLYLVKK